MPINVMLFGRQHISKFCQHTDAAEDHLWSEVQVKNTGTGEKISYMKKEKMNLKSGDFTELHRNPSYNLVFDQ